MNFHYPNGRKFIRKEAISINKIKNTTYSNRGMTLEEDLNETNKFYLDYKIAVVHKKPTPVQIVNVDYPKRSAAVIKEAYFKQASTTDYNGIYKGKYVDFEAKETKFTSSFPLKNFHVHQINHMKDVLKHEGICFVILRFTTLEEVYFLKAENLIQFWERMEDGGRKSITKKEIETNGYQIKLGFRPRIDYIKVINDLYNLS
ncbi:Holliday junction resolvase RecU [Bacillus sp. B15-48]|uniref:Holliday junction resolvase RecU n=1 Tax=Bacillus sp. B15-48 TaxID=1548601 RepID=UPI00193F9AAE|nr:Holliday junction resolvase RecU [Bacillus sp. B15-48]MBM4762087.1 Holliday junction resolvase RecU [Bacillus sp. B15-48]